MSRFFINFSSKCMKNSGKKLYEFKADVRTQSRQLIL
jgi:hypothetical protein